MHHSGHIQVHGNLNLHLCEKALHQSTGSNLNGSSSHMILSALPFTMHLDTFVMITKVCVWEMDSYLHWKGLNGMQHVRPVVYTK